MVTSLMPYYNAQLVLILAFLFLCLCWYVNFVWRKRDMFIKSWNYPGPFNFPLIGAAYKLMARPEFILRRIIKMQYQYPKGFKMWFGNRLIYVLHEPDQIEKILGSTKLVQKDYLYKYIADAIGEGLFTAPPQKWKKHRKHVAVSFNQKVLDSYVEVFAEQSLLLNEILSENFGNKIDIYETLFKCTLDVLCETAMGFQLNVQRNNADHGHTINKIMLLGCLKIFQIWNHFDFIWKLLGYDKKLKAHLKKLNDLTDQVIRQKIEEREAKQHRKSSLACIEEIPVKRLAFLDYIMECGQFDALELREEVNIFLFAGTDTTAATLSFVFAVLGMFQHIQQKVFEEVVQIMGDDRLPESQDLPHMSYTERVIKETLRLFPVGDFFAREITEDVEMGDFVVPKGASAYFGLVFNHRNPKYWKDPLKFDPDRFQPEEVAKRHPCTYIPFSYGPRNCIGMKYGMMVMKVIIAQVVRKFQIHCEYKNIEDIKLKTNIVLRFADGAKVSVKPRKS